MPRLTITFEDGETVPLEQCEWVFYDACGCPFGSMLPVSPLSTAYDEETAFRDFYDHGDTRKRDIEQRITKARKAGVSAELMTREKWRREVEPKLRDEYRCPHRLQEAAA